MTCVGSTLGRSTLEKKTACTAIAARPIKNIFALLFVIRRDLLNTADVIIARRSRNRTELPSLAKEGRTRHQKNGPLPLKARPGRFVQQPIIGGLNQPPCLRPLKSLRGIFLIGAGTPPRES